MEQKISNLVVKAKQVLNLLENHFKENLPKRTIDKYDQLLFSAIIKGIRTYRCIIGLCEIGEGENASILLRNLFETIIIIYWLLHKKSLRSKRMTLYKEKETIDTYSLVKDIKQIKIENPKELEKLKRKFKRLMKKYNARKNADLIFKHKKIFPSLKHLSKEKYRIDHKIQSFDTYYNNGPTYAYLSSYAHFGPFTKNTNFVNDKIKGLGLILGPRFNLVPQTLFLANHFILILFDLFNKNFDLKLKEQDTINKEFKELFDIAEK